MTQNDLALFIEEHAKASKVRVNGKTHWGRVKQLHEELREMLEFTPVSMIDINATCLMLLELSARSFIVAEKISKGEKL